jgi:hypothetical protein
MTRVCVCVCVCVDASADLKNYLQNILLSLKDSGNIDTFQLF